MSTLVAICIPDTLSLVEAMDLSLSLFLYVYVYIYIYIYI